MSDLQRIIDSEPSARRQGDNWLVRCPAHDDATASLSIRQSESGGVLLHCFAGCSFDAIMREYVARGILESRTERRVTMSTPTKAMKIYSYETSDGKLLFQVLRTPEKQFLQRRPDGKGGFIWNTQRVEKLLYRTPELVSRPRETVYVMEGEKDVDLAHSLGLLATCNAGGAGKWSVRYSRQLAGREVVVIPDNDQPGRVHADKVAGALREARCRVKVLTLPSLPAKGDFTDWVRAGGTVEKLAGLVTAASESAVRSPLKILSLEDVQEESVQWLWPGRIPLGKVTLISGDPNLGKSFLTLDIAARVSTGAGWPDLSGVSEVGKVLLLNAEDDPADTVKPRLIAAGADVAQVDILQGVEIPGSDDNPMLRLVSLEYDLQTICQRLKEAGGVYRLVVIDPISAYMEGVDSNSNTEVRRLLTQIGTIAAETHCAFVVVSHLRKGGGGRAIHRTMGSLAFTAAARAVWTVILDPGGADMRRLFMPVKLNLVEEPIGLGYYIRNTRCEWDDVPVTDSLDDIMSGAREKVSAPSSDRLWNVKQCSVHLRLLLEDGPQPTAAAVKELRRLGYTEKQIQCARKLLNVKATRSGPKEPWIMSLSANS